MVPWVEFLGRAEDWGTKMTFILGGDYVFEAASRNFEFERRLSLGNTIAVS